ncbi:MAG: hypothetical protein ORN50_05155, partial [Crocinitomicaceae bacterium]|nr:hypothetical protein [Crocinitomicaceae bacterium]
MQANVESQTMLSADMELIETKNKVKQLEQEIAFLNSDLQEKLQFISNIEYNLGEHHAWVDNWKDSEGNEFTGSIYWTKKEGSSKQGYATYFEGEWDLAGDIVQGELTHNC